jgi:hypothetical protein
VDSLANNDPGTSISVINNCVFVMIASTETGGCLPAPPAGVPAELFFLSLQENNKDAEINTASRKKRIGLFTKNY